jgi:N-acetylglutamate synthase-like GNAT family acetyltransferase
MGNNIILKKFVSVITVSEVHIKYVKKICQLIEEAAKARGTGIAKRSPQYIKRKISEGKAVIAIAENDQLAGFCYLETWDHGKYVANSGLIVSPDFRGMGIGKVIKKATFELSRKKYPQAKIFGITTSPAVLKINSQLGYRPVSFEELTNDEEFWNGCQSCTNYDILIRTSRRYCLCTAMVFNPEDKSEDELTQIPNEPQLGNDVF